MAEYTGTFETGVNGNDVSAGDAGSADAWDVVVFASPNSTLQYSDTEKYGTLSAKAVFDATGGQAFVAWDSTTLGTGITTIYGRVYMHHSGLPNTLCFWVRGFDVSDRAWESYIGSDGKIVVRDKDGTQRGAGAVAISTGQWIRLEFKAVSSETAGVVEVKLFNDPDSITPTETITSTGSFSTLTKTDLLRIGETSALNVSRTVYIDNVLANDTGYPGPAGELTRIRTPKRLVGPTLVTNSPVTGYTVPATYVTRMRHVHISNPSGSPVDMTLSIGTDAAATRLLDGKPIAADSVYEMACDEALAAGEIVQMFASSTNVLTITISGEEWVPA